MAIIKCPNNHFYDNGKYDTCPHCLKDSSTASGSSSSLDIGENKTIAKGSNFSVEDNIKTQSLRNMVRNNVDEVQKTVPKYFSDRNINPIAGWLVCIEGENRGRSFEIHMGKNFVGRSMKNDIHINDDRVSRDNHFSIIYDPVNIEFYVMQGNGITYYNDEVLSDAVQLKEGNTITAGVSKYVFIQYCREGRNWDDEEKQDN